MRKRGRWFTRCLIMYRFPAFLFLYPVFRLPGEVFIAKNAGECYTTAQIYRHLYKFMIG